MEWIEAQRFVTFLGLMALFMALEAAWPRKKRTQTRLKRWPANLLVVTLDGLLLRLLMPLVALDVALLAQDRSWGLLNQVDWSTGWKVLVTLVALDGLIYWQHRLFHRVPLLWRIHRVHHTDPDIDVTTALRFHPIEIIASMIIKMGAVVLLGAPMLGVLIFEIVLNGMAMFNHSNLNLPVALDRIIRMMVVTPDMHRVHHSNMPEETNSNYGFNLAFWDRLFHSYKAQPSRGHDDVKIGLIDWPAEQVMSLWSIIKIPFLSK